MNRRASLLPLKVMDVWPLVRLLLFLLPIGLVGAHLVPAPPAGTSSTPAAAGAPGFISAPRQSLPTPVHDEATCAFCQAAAFAPHTASPADGLPLLTGAERYDTPSPDNRLTHFATSRPPRSRAPPSLRLV